MPTDSDSPASSPNPNRLEHDSPDPTRPELDGPEPTRPELDGPALDAVVVENGDEFDECAIFRRDGTEAELLGEWISALEGSFVDLDSSR